MVCYLILNGEWKWEFLLQLIFLAQRLSFKDTIKLIKEAGFDAYDMSLFCMYDNPNPCIFCEDGYLETAKELRRYADEIGIVVQVFCFL